MGIRCKILSWDDVYELAKETARKVKASGFQPDAIVGVARGGWFHARVLCDLLGVKDLYSIKVGHWGITAEKDQEGAKLHQGLNVNLEGKKVLVVDDITDTGQSLELARKHVLEAGNPSEVRTATLLHIVASKYTPDYYGRETEWAWMIFPWNYWEDLANLIQKMLESKEMSPGEIVEYFHREHGVDVPISDVREALGELADRDIVGVKQVDGKEVYYLTRLVR